MIRHFTCIVCPNGCDIEASLNAEGGIDALTGMACPKGKDYVIRELTNPQRTLSSSVTVRCGELPLVSVRLNRPIPKARIMDVMTEIRKAAVEAPTQIGDVVIANVLGLGSDVIITKNVKRL